jgi:hypothetical protein
VFNAGGNIAPDPGKIVCSLDQEQADAVKIEYRALLMEGEVECPPPDEDKEERKGKRGEYLAQ